MLKRAFLAIFFVFYPFKSLLAQNFFKNGAWSGIAANRCQAFLFNDDHKKARPLYKEAEKEIIDAMNKVGTLKSKGEAVIGDKANSEFKYLWIRSYCKKNPTASYGDAVRDLFFFLEKQGL